MPGELFTWPENALLLKKSSKPGLNLSGHRFIGSYFSNPHIIIPSINRTGSLNEAGLSKFQIEHTLTTINNEVALSMLNLFLLKNPQLIVFQWLLFFSFVSPGVYSMPCL